MAQLREGSVIKKSTGDEVIATVNDIPEIPTSLPADGGNADTVDGKHVDDSKTDINSLWTASKIVNYVASAGYGDMLKSQYDTDSDGIVDRAETADKLTTARTISLSGDVVGSTIFDGSADISINTTRLIKNNSFILDSLYTFTRSSTAYLSDGTLVNMNLPRFEQGKFGKAVMVEEGTENLVPSLVDFTLRDHGSNSLTVIDDNMVISTCIAEGDTAFVATSPKVNVTEGEIYTFSFYAKANGLDELDGRPSAGDWRTKINWYDGNNTLIAWDMLTDTILYEDWKRYIITAQAPTGAVKAEVKIGGDSPNFSYVGAKVYFKNIQFEQKPYATSFTDGTRAAETLTIPTEGVLNLQEGTIECWVYVNDLIKDNSAQRAIFSCIYQVGSSANNIILRHESSNWKAVITNESGQITNIVTADNLKIGWHYFAIKWSPSEFVLFIDGIRVGSAANPYRPSSLGAQAYVGSYTSSYGFINTLIDDLRISNRARTDAEILAAYQSNEPLPYDAYTTWLSRFDNNYGLIGNSSNQIPVSNGILCTNLNAERTNGIKITASTTAPTSPQINDIWIDLN